VVGERRADGLHRVATVMQRIDICDRISLEPAPQLDVTGFAADTLVQAALEVLAEAAGRAPSWAVQLDKEIPVAAGLGGGSADAAAALVLANQTLPKPLPEGELHAVAAQLGADVPFFLAPGPKLAEGAGERLTPLELPQDYWVVLALPHGASKPSTRDVYTRFDELEGGESFAERAASDLAAFPPNDLAEAAGRPSVVDDLLAAGAFRADVSGAGPAVYGLFVERRDAQLAARRCRRGAEVWVIAPVW
jgi:4-diphosphocytidyl-2-C-methyl-D-erythritol kinase